MESENKTPRPYHKPLLKTHGTLVDLTKATKGNGVDDGGSGSSKKTL